MSQLEWMIGFIPDSILNLVYWAIIAFGVSGILAGWIGRLIPVYGKYARFLKPIGVLFLCLGLYLRGGYDTEMAWRGKVKEAEDKVAQAEQKAQEAADELAKKSDAKVKVIKGKEIVVKQYIDREVKIYDSRCEIPKSFVKAHNDAASAPEKTK